MEMKGINQMIIFFIVIFYILNGPTFSQEKVVTNNQTKAVQLDSIQILILAKLDLIGDKISYLKLRDKQFTQYQEAVRYFNDTVLVIIQRAIDSLYIEKETLKRYLNGH
jgi:hypothetical protein